MSKFFDKYLKRRNVEQNERKLKQNTYFSKVDKLLNALLELKDISQAEQRKELLDILRQVIDKIFDKLPELNKYLNETVDYIGTKISPQEYYLIIIEIKYYFMSILQQERPKTLKRLMKANAEQQERLYQRFTLSKYKPIKLNNSN